MCEGLMNCYRLLLDTAVAVGTVGATVLALWSILRERKRRVEGVFVWDFTTEYKPVVLVQNTSSRVIVIESIEIQYGTKKRTVIRLSEDYHLAEYAIFEAKETKRIPIDIDRDMFGDWLKPKKKRMLKIVLKVRNGRRYVSKQKYSYEELWGLSLGKSLFSKE